MKKYFTSLNLIDNKFVATLHDPDNNQIVYTSKPYNSQIQATDDVNEYITKIKTTTTSQTPQKQNFINTIARIDIPRSGGCCGRR